MIDVSEERRELEKETIREAIEYVAGHITVNGKPLCDVAKGVKDYMEEHLNLHEKDDVFKLFGLHKYTLENGAKLLADNAGVEFNGQKNLVKVWLRNLNAPYDTVI